MSSGDETALPSVWLQDLTWEEVASYLRHDAVAIVPVGAVEQHGPAGPLGVDSYVAIMIAEDVARRTGTLCTPPIWFGDSLHHLGFPGTIALRPQTLTLVLQDVCRSLVRHGFTRIVLVNGNKGSNMPAMVTAVRTLHEEEAPNAVFVIADPLNLAKHTAGSIKGTNEHHSGELELSQVMYRYPELVRADRVTDAHVDFDRVFGGFVGSDLFGPAPEGVEIMWSGLEERAMTPTGSFSSSIGISSEKGRAYHEHLVRRLSEVVEWLRTYTGPIGAVEVSGR
jgi:creatinine amidohydrolase